MQEFDYAFYPTLLDSYFRYKRAEDKLSFIQLMDKINKVKEELDPENEEHIPRLKGIAFEGLINSIITTENTHLVDDVFVFNGFEFNKELVLKVYDKLQRCPKIQYYQEKIIDTPRGKVKIYGIFDYKFPKMTADLKGVQSYKYGKFKDNMQHKFASLISEDKEFNYIATDYDYMFIENYWLNDKLREQAIVDIIEFIDFIEYFKKYITDTKIFGK